MSTGDEHDPRRVDGVSSVFAEMAHDQEAMGQNAIVLAETIATHDPFGHPLPGKAREPLIVEVPTLLKRLTDAGIMKP